ncbi:sulfotransferase family protein [Phenylobacterium sp.]|jgi:hypothetical protein|uniref:sulfotransferase family protein n=1 Tax=Phenylobacterium sp. TaxID=1871053 RepID=UPI003784ED0F
MTTPPPADRRARDRTAYLVLGMHRSGTSAVTQLLALAGANLPEHVMPGDEHNAKGYFEPWRIAQFNDRCLRAGGGAWDDVFAFPHRPLARKDERGWLTEAIDLFEAEYGPAEFPLLKDPRVTVLLPFWRTVLEDLGIAARCVIPVRHPLAVAGSLSRRDGFAPEKSVLLWSAYMLAAEAYTRDLPRAFVGYDALLSDWRAEAARIETAHGAPLPALTRAASAEIDKFLTADLRHNAAGDGLAALGWAGEIAQAVLDWFEAAAAGEAPDRGPLEAAGAELERRRREVGVLVSPTSRDLDAVRSELREVRDALAAQIADLRAEMARDRQVLEAGWRQDAAELSALQGQWQALSARLDGLLAEA